MLVKANQQFKICFTDWKTLCTWRRAICIFQGSLLDVPTNCDALANHINKLQDHSIVMSLLYVPQKLYLGEKLEQGASLCALKFKTTEFGFKRTNFITGSIV